MATEIAVPVRKIPLGRRALTGRHTVPGRRSVAFESSLERDFITLMLFEPDTLDIEEQPVRIQLPQGRHYTPDFLVTRQGRPPLLVEIKPEIELSAPNPQLSDKLDAAAAWATARGWIFETWSEKQIRIPRLENAKFLLPFRDRKVDAGIAARLLAFATKGMAEVEELVGAAFPIEAERGRALAALWHLMALGRLSADLDQPLTPKTIVRVPKERGR